jgi:hypothetical protein
MPVRPHASRSLTAALAGLSAALILSIILTGCGVGGPALEWTWVNGTSTDANGYNWTAEATSPAPQDYASNFAEFARPATDLWSWASGSEAQDKTYVAVMPELTPEANSWTWVNDSTSTGNLYALATTGNVNGAPYCWTASAAPTPAIYASNRENRFWEFTPATELWSWVSGSSTQNNIYLASMPELNPTTNNWAWVSGNDSGSYGTQGLAALGKLPGTRCVDWVEAGDPLAVCGDELQANLKDYYRYGP